MSGGQPRLDIDDELDPHVIAAMRGKRPSTVQLIRGGSIDEGTNANIQLSLRRSADSDADSASVFEGMVRPCIGELLAIMLFTYVGVLAASSGDVIVIALAHGLGIIILVSAFGSISGAHINPSVTLAVFLAGELTIVKSALYVGSQLLGATLGAGLARITLGSEQFHNVTKGPDFSGGVHTGVGEALLCETMLTTILVLVVLMSAVDTKGKLPYAGVSIGLTVAGNIFAGAKVSGASMNPARSFGPALVSSDYTDVWDYHYVFWVGPIVGSLIASALFRSLLAHRDRRFFFKHD